MKLNTAEMSNDELGLLITGLRAIFIANREPMRQRMLKQLEDALAARGLKVAA